MKNMLFYYDFSEKAWNILSYATFVYDLNNLDGLTVEKQEKLKISILKDIYFESRKGMFNRKEKDSSIIYDSKTLNNYFLPLEFLEKLDKHIVTPEVITRKILHLSAYETLTELLPLKELYNVEIIHNHED